MIRSIIIAVVALLIGLAVGWKVRYLASDGHDGIQWKLTDAAGRGDIAEMERLIAAGADPLKFPSYADGAVTGATPLLEAASAGEPVAVSFLINKGADVNLQESDVRPLDAAEHRLQQAERTIQILRAHLLARSEGFTTKAIIQSEQAGAGQPATRSESGSEGGDKPQPEAEGRSR
ncbi:MAG: hypothetical protein RLZZ505_1368 [Verrucomicrobiota bacterium]|jgi:hypothetical protein